MKFNTSAKYLTRYFLLTSAFLVTTLLTQNCSNKFSSISSTDLSSTSGIAGLPGSVQQEILNGQKLYANYCSSCHLDNSGVPSKQGRTVNDIQAAILNIPLMKASTAVQGLTGVQIQSIAEFLKQPQLCKVDFVPAKAPIRVLSNDEYDNTISDIFVTTIKPSSLAKFDQMVAGSSGFTNDLGSVSISDLMIEKYWNAAQIIADDVVASKGQVGKAYTKIAACAVNANPVADACYDSIVRSLALKVWRRPISESAANNEFSRLKAIFKDNTSFDQGLKDLVKSLLMSPNFLTLAYVPNTQAVAAGQAFLLNDFQLATRLSYFLWQSSPDDELLSLANSAQLSNTNTLKQQIMRMLKDAKAKRLAGVLTNEWLGIGRLSQLGITAIDTNTLNAMVTETSMMFQDIMTSDLNLATALSADYSFLNQALAQYYGVPFSGTNANTFYKTDISSTQRRGVLNQAAFLITTAGSPLETHPVTRGKILANKIACAEIGPPPADVSTTLPTNLPPNSTPAEVLAVHTKKVQCSSCHNILDPYGLGFETYDSQGRYRSTYVNLANREVVQSGILPTGEAYTSTQNLVSIMSQSPSVKSCMAKKVMSLALARAPQTVDDNCVASNLGQNSLQAQSTFSDFIMGVVSSRQFKMQTSEAP